MKVINFSDQNSIINQYLAEMRDKDYQQNRLLFRNNIQRVGEMMAYEISKTLDYQQKTVHTPLADAEVSVPVDDVVVATIFRADPMFATGGSMELGWEALVSKGRPKHVHVACVIATPEGVDYIKTHLPEENTTIWCAAIDPGLNENKYIVPGFGDAGDLCYGDKL